MSKFNHHTPLYERLFANTERVGEARDRGHIRATDPRGEA